MADKKDSPIIEGPGYSVSSENQESFPKPLPMPKDNEEISEAVFNLLFKDLIACESIRSYMEKIHNEFYGRGLTQDTFNRKMCELVDKYITDEVTTEDKATIIRYISAFAKIENNVKASLCTMAVPANGQTAAGMEEKSSLHPCHGIIQTYVAVQEMINKWAFGYGVRHNLEPDVVYTPNLDWDKWIAD